MGLNIKNERVHDLARRASQVTGKTQTGAIEEALLKLLNEYGIRVEDDDRKQRVDTVLGLLAEIDLELERTAPGEIRGVEDLYDDATGLPR
ncbi:MAG: type II toxin-antitoxin system VapB family antitoxin [Dermatophilus congolensis]|nr:type II toxin-antitoxin system VapB family antitoxin [Dermatophilus congolensis]